MGEDRAGLILHLLSTAGLVTTVLPRTGPGAGYKEKPKLGRLGAGNERGSGNSNRKKMTGLLAGGTLSVVWL